ncbi:RNA polymerase subunit sigma-32 [Fibrobacter sp. UWB2]|jgi:RNA polymerase primary sigma factor|uniref:RNA polymerase primary sigma factor n=1 Tax=Fibrobacter succinogenes TaxID=833 RepID=A0A380S6C3_FIBSU|nr:MULTISPECIES: RNA polymerase sigma factor RpoD/SigA [Fibrobacter]MBO6075879.1 RNA polymerase sigma factor RpoD/SigA [Fibrobacter sp.]OWV21080.1 RNA polymerase subunit sigma-32 [Fibrobacter sp. UWB2]PWJ35461.1 RNA polymerase primary sigma factor [Fibrobacter succinogenes subsp. elongatus]SUQ24116.1 RNA polymerase primary sigma factor [Fibrobacter succinogenes]
MKTLNNHDQKDIYMQYLNDISRYPLLTREQETILLKKSAEGNKAALDMLVNANLRFVVNIANLYKGRGLDIMELINEGNMGLIEAARRFDRSQNIKFISYAVWWIRQNITRAISEKGRMIRISAEKELMLRRFNRHAKDVQQVIGGTYTVNAQSLEGLSKYKANEIEKILMMGSSAASLDTPVNEDGDATLGDTISDSQSRTDELADNNNRAEVFDKVMDKNLSSQEKEILKLYYGFKMDSDLNLKEIAPMVGLSKERVRQLKENALNKLRDADVERLLCEAA